jgi:hypothetical protein
LEESLLALKQLLLCVGQASKVDLQGTLKEARLYPEGLLVDW